MESPTPRCVDDDKKLATAHKSRAILWVAQYPYQTMTMMMTIRTVKKVGSLVPSDGSTGSRQMKPAVSQPTSCA